MQYYLVKYIPSGGKISVPSSPSLTRQHGRQGNVSRENHIQCVRALLILSEIEDECNFLYCKMSSDLRIKYIKIILGTKHLYP